MSEGRLLPKPIAYPIFVFTGFLAAFCFVTEEMLAAEGNILWTAGETFRILGISLAAGGVFGVLCCKLFYSLPERAADERGGGLKIFCGSLILTFAAWFPAFLAYYPAICAYDITIQTGQIVSGSYIDHHPIAHTLLLKIFMQFGERMFGDVSTGIACYALFQMLFLAGAFAFGMRCLYRKGARWIWLFAVQLSCMLYPFHAYMSVSVTKDTVFSSFFLLCLIALWEVTAGKMRYLPLFILSGIGVILFRTNGKYAFLVLLAFLFGTAVFNTERGTFRERKDFQKEKVFQGKKAFWGKIFAAAIGIFLAGNLALSGIFKAVGAEQGDRREMLCLPIQQLARTMVYHGGVGVLPEDDGAMAEVDRALINDFILNEGYRKYRPDFTDPVKNNTNTYVARFRAKDFLSTYLGLFLQFPGDYLNAALAVNAGYLYPGDISHAYINAQEGQADGSGYVQTRWEEGTLNERGIYKGSKWPALFERMERWAGGNAYLRYPLLKYLFVPGVWIWLYLLLIQWLLIRRRFAACLPHTLVFGYFLTLLLGPTVQLRYLYPIMISFPFLLGLGILPEKEIGGG